jgi:vacuolar-type H+-ATPase subunit I/STV1
VAILCFVGWFEKKLMVMSVLVGFQNMSVSVVDGFRMRSRPKKFICPLLSCVGFFCVFVCMVHIGSDRVRVHLLESYIIKISSM